MAKINAVNTKQINVLKINNSPVTGLNGLERTTYNS